MRWGGEVTWPGGSCTWEREGGPPAAKEPRSPGATTPVPTWPLFTLTFSHPYKENSAKRDRELAEVPGPCLTLRRPPSCLPDRPLSDPCPSGFNGVVISMCAIPSAAFLPGRIR